VFATDRKFVVTGEFWFAMGVGVQPVNLTFGATSVPVQLIAVPFTRIWPGMTNPRVLLTRRKF
jgi:hypothetical protein